VGTADNDENDEEAGNCDQNGFSNKSAAGAWHDMGDEARLWPAGDGGRHPQELRPPGAVMRDWSATCIPEVDEDGAEGDGSRYFQIQNDLSGLDAEISGLRQRCGDMGEGFHPSPQ